MSFYEFDEKTFVAWQNSIEKSHHAPGWNEYDEVVKQAVKAFHDFHLGKAGYIGPRWTLIKAMLWVESGPTYHDAWSHRPMQIGNPGDSGMLDVLNHPHMSMIAPEAMRKSFSATTIGNDPKVNIQAGLALLHLKLARFRMKAVTDLAAKPAAFGPAHSTKPKSRPYICGWSPFCSTTLYMNYNLGVAAYAKKLDYCVSLIERDLAG